MKVRICRYHIRLPIVPQEHLCRLVAQILCWTDPQTVRGVSHIREGSARLEVSVCEGAVCVGGECGADEDDGVGFGTRVREVFCCWASSC